MKLGFDNDKYIRIQSEHIKERIAHFEGKLYLELGGKLFDDHHASRVLPGFQPDSKLRMLSQLADSAEIIIVISATDIEKNKVRADLGITYDEDVLRLRSEFESRGFYVGGVVITHYNGQASAKAFRERLERMGISTHYQYFIEGYPRNVDVIASPDGFGRNEYVETTRPLVIVTAPGPGSGKMAVCLSQLYNEAQHGVRAGYAKFETFPVWNLPLKHPVNIAYEAATADLGDVNMIDPFHLEAYGETTVNYNRDIEIFPVLNALFEHVWGKSPYKSPTDMGVNMAGMCITDDQVCREAAEKEILRRYYATRCSFLQGHAAKEEAEKIRLLMKHLNLDDTLRPVIGAARERAESTGAPALAIELPDGEIITGKTTDLLGPSAAVILNAVKRLGNISKNIHLIPPEVIEPVQELKCKYLGNHNPRLHSDEVLVALSVSAASDPNAAKALSMLPQLKNCEAHSTVILPAVDDNTFRRLGLNLTCDPSYQTHKLYHK